MLDFLGIGAQKAGTTWLYEMLKCHPRIAFPAGKEVRFWNQGPKRDIMHYRSLFRDRWFERCGIPHKKKGEITPAYALLPVPVIREIFCEFPALRIIYIIRNPIERAWSAALMALWRAEMEIGEASDQWFIDHFRSKGSTARGDYETCLRRWRDVFPIEQILVLRFDLLPDDPAQFLARCLRHIGVEASSIPVSRFSLHERVFAGPGHELRPALRNFLVKQYETRIASLSSYLQEDLSAWLVGGDGHEASVRSPPAAAIGLTTLP